jgi:ferritin-like metal-binding protein YciE
VPHELLVERLHQMLWVEERLAEDLLPTVYDRVHAIDLKYGVERHLFETRQHVMTVRTILNLLGERQDPVESTAFVVTLGTTELELCEQLAQIEHFEAAAYTFLRTLANALGYDDIGIRLTEVIEQEEYALELVQKATAKLLAENVANA